MNGFVLDAGRLTGFHHQSVNIGDRVNRIRRPALLGFHLI
jgi:hypothetical protein